MVKSWTRQHLNLIFLSALYRFTTTANPFWSLWVFSINRCGVFSWMAYCDFLESGSTASVTRWPRRSCHYGQHSVKILFDSNHCSSISSPWQTTFTYWGGTASENLKLPFTHLNFYQSCICCTTHPWPILLAKWIGVKQVSSDTSLGRTLRINSSGSCSRGNWFFAFLFHQNIGGRSKGTRLGTWCMFVA